jgi:hypothetical protein
MNNIKEADPFETAPFLNRNSMKKIMILIIVLAHLVACKENGNDFTLFPVPENNKINIKYRNIHIDSIILNDEGVESSLEGFTGITTDKKNIYFIDCRFCWYYLFDFNGNFVSRTFGYGQGPKETTVGRIYAYSILSDTSLFVSSASMHDYYVYDKDFYKKKFFMLPYEPGHSDADDWRTYTFFGTLLICRSYGYKIYLPVWSDVREDFSYLYTTKEYLNNAHSIFEVDLEKGQVGKLYAKGFPPIYHKDPGRYGCFWFTINFDIDNKGFFYTSYEADPLIYKYDTAYNPLYSFGYPGQNMDTDYTGNNCREEREKIKGHYSYIEYIDETDLLFRSYKKGSHTANDGLQIYSGTTLIADIEVPKDFRVAGYAEPYYYSHVIADEEKEIMTVYRFKLD